MTKLISHFKFLKQRFLNFCGSQTLSASYWKLRIPQEET